MHHVKPRRWICRSLLLTLVFSIFVNSAWSQSSGSFSRVIPQIAIGSFDGGLTRYSTVIEIINTNAISVTLSASFFREDGTTALIPLATNLPGVPAIIGGTFAGVVLDPDKVLVISSGTTSAPGIIAWSKIVSDLQVTISTFYELRGTVTNALRSRVGIPASLDNITKFVVPRVRNVATGLDVGFALVNTSPFLASLTVTLMDAGGATIAIRNLVMPGNSHQSLLTQQFFSLANEPPGMNYQYIVFDAGTAGQFAAAGLAFEGDTQTSVPVDVLR